MAIQNFVKERLSRHEYPREIEFLESLPKTEAGKIRKEELTKWFLLGEKSGSCVFSRPHQSKSPF